MMSRSTFAAHSISTVPKEGKPPATNAGAAGRFRLRTTVRELEGPLSPVSSIASALTTYGPSTTEAAFHVNLHTVAVASSAVAVVGCATPSRNHWTVFAADETVALKAR